MKFAALILLLSCLSAHGQSIVIDRVNAQSPDVVVIEFNFVAGSDIRGLQLEVPFDPRLPAPTVAEDCGQTVDAFVAGCAFNAGTLKILIAGAQSLSSGVLARVELAITQQTPAGEYPLELDIVAIADVNNEPLPASVLPVTSGAVVVTPAPISLTPGQVDLTTRLSQAQSQQITVGNALSVPLAELVCSYSGDVEIGVESLSKTTFAVDEQRSVTVSCGAAQEGEYAGSYDCQAQGGLQARALLRCVVVEPQVTTLPGLNGNLLVGIDSRMGQVSFAETGGVFGYSIDQCEVGAGYRIDTPLPLSVSPGAAVSIQVSALPETSASDVAVLECLLDTGLQARFLVLQSSPGSDPGPDFSSNPGGPRGPSDGVVAVPTLSHIGLLVFALSVIGCLFLRPGPPAREPRF